MTFRGTVSKEIRKRAGYYCQICGSWHPPRKGAETGLDAHSLDRTHLDAGMAVCRSRVSGRCHATLHRLTEDGEELERLSRTAMELNNLSMAVQMTDMGVPERRIRRVLARLGSF